MYGQNRPTCGKETLANFRKNWIEQDSMLRNFEIIGEAANHISDNIKERFTRVSWHKIRGMRNLVAHEYFGVKLETIWETAVHDIPILKEQIKEIIQNLKQ